MAIATLGGLKSSPKAIPAPLTFVDRDLGEWRIRRHFATVASYRPFASCCRTVRPLPWWSSAANVCFRALCGLTLPAPAVRLSSGSLEPRCFRTPGVPPPLGVGANVCCRAPGPGADQTLFMADASNYRLLLSLVVNLELMDVVKEKKYKDNK